MDSQSHKYFKAEYKELCRSHKQM